MPIVRDKLLLGTMIWAYLSFVAAIAVASAPSPPPASSYAPAEDLERQVVYYIGLLEKTLSVPSDQYTEAKQYSVKKTAATLGALSLVLANHDKANHDKDNRLNNAALFDAVRKVADDAADQNKATEDLTLVKQAADNPKGDVGQALDWQIVGQLELLMKQVQTLNSRLKRGVKGKKFKTNAEKTTGYSVTLAAIAQAAMTDVSKAENDEDAAKWYQFCAQMRDAAGQVNAAIRRQDEQATAAGLAALKKSCDDCHAVFEKEQL